MDCTISYLTLCSIFYSLQMDEDDIMKSLLDKQEADEFRDAVADVATQRATRRLQAGFFMEGDDEN